MADIETRKVLGAAAGEVAKQGTGRLLEWLAPRWRRWLVTVLIYFAPLGGVLFGLFEAGKALIAAHPYGVISVACFGAGAWAFFADGLIRRVAERSPARLAELKGKTATEGILPATFSDYGVQTQLREFLTKPRIHFCLNTDAEPEFSFDSGTGSLLFRVSLRIVNSSVGAVELTRKDREQRMVEIEGVAGARIVIPSLTVENLDGQTAAVSELRLEPFGEDVVHLSGSVPNGRRADLSACLERKSNGFDVCFKVFCSGALLVRRDGAAEGDICSFRLQTYMPMSVNMRYEIYKWAAL